MIYTFSTTPHAHQEVSLQRSAEQENFALFLEMGLGKSKIILDTAGMLHAKGKILNLLITAPNGVHRQWVEEQAPIHLAEYPYKCIVFDSQKSNTKKWAKKMDAVLINPIFLRIFTINVEAMITQGGEAFARKVLGSGPTLWALDESVSIKAPGSKRTKKLLSLSMLATYRRILSGAPITKGAEDLYTQLRFLDHRILGHKSFYSFRNNYCITEPIYGAPRGAVQIVGYRNLDELKQRLSKHIVRFRVADCLNLPPRIYMTREVEMTKEQAKAYEWLKYEFFYEIENHTITTEQAIIRLLRLQQVLSGYVKTDEGDIISIPSNRIRVLQEVVTEAAGKVVIWARFHRDIDEIKKALQPLGVVVWDGRTPVNERVEAKRRFMEDDDTTIFLANQQAAGLGIDGLQHASSTMIYYSNNFSLNDRLQSEARLHRFGQRGAVRVVDLQVPNSLDSYIVQRLRDNQEIAEHTLDIRPGDF